MTEREIEKLFQSLKNDHTMGESFDSETSRALVTKACGFAADREPAAYGVRDYIEFYIWQFSNAALKPVMASAAFVVLLFTGWIGATNASFDSLPGDRLYPVKLSMEKLQLAAALDGEQRARLELEFTGRRLNEMVELTAEHNLANPVRVRIAVDNFKDTVSSISNELTTDSSTTLAKAVGRKTQVYRSAVKSSTKDVPKEVADQVAEVTDLIDTTEDQAVEVIITAHENQDDAETAAELKLTFEQQIAAIDVGDRIELAEKLERARALADQSAYRRAFELLKEIELLLKQQP